ncbi:hypothetical protein CTA2_6863, partial [Colletotrichum tanaceti]
VLSGPAWHEREGGRQRDESLISGGRKSKGQDLSRTRYNVPCVPHGLLCLASAATICKKRGALSLSSSSIRNRLWSFVTAMAVKLMRKPGCYFLEKQWKRLGFLETGLKLTEPNSYWCW